MNHENEMYGMESIVNNTIVTLAQDFFLISWPLSAVSGILVPQPGVEPAPPALEAWSFNHLATREVPA